MKRKFGAPAGAFFGVNGPQSALESRTSSLITPLKALAGSGAFGAGCSREQPATASTAARRISLRFMVVSPGGTKSCQLWVWSRLTCLEQLAPLLRAELLAQGEAHVEPDAERLRFDRVGLRVDFVKLGGRGIAPPHQGEHHLAV